MANSVRIRPEQLNAAIAWLFMIGSACFALGAVPIYASKVGAVPDAITFFVGSLFFTSASYLQLVQAQSPWMAPGASYGAQRPVAWAWMPRDRGWLSAATQFPGTIAFNLSTGFAIFTATATTQQIDRAVWRPDFVGSTLFLVSSAFAIAAVSGGFWQPGSWSWRIAWLNMLGSIAFMASAIASYVIPATGGLVDPRWADLGTFLGALCFLVGARLMLPAWQAATEGRGERW